MNVSELKIDLLARGIRPSAVRFDDSESIAVEYYCISQQQTLWEVYYFERGVKNNLQLFSDEAQACAYLKSLLDSDRTVWSTEQKQS